MILLDIDGCITAGKGQAIELKALQALKESIARNKRITTLCTGRSAAYVEAIAQTLAIGEWCICENGAYLYHSLSDEVIYHPNISTQVIECLSEVKTKLTTEAKYKHLCKLELGKEICISLNPKDISIESLYEIIKEDMEHKDLYIAHSTTAVDITPNGINKGSAMQLLCKHKEINNNCVLGVGDTMGDVSFLKLCGQVACPSNAITAIQELADFVSSSPNTQGLVEIYCWLENLA